MIPAPRRKASSLIMTLLVLVVLSIIVIAFLQSMTIERMTARSTMNQYKAQLISDSALEVAVKSLLVTTNQGPLSTTFAIEPGGTAPYLLQAKLTNAGGQVALIRYPQFTTRQEDGVFSNLSAACILTNGWVVADRERDGSAASRNLTSPGDVYVNLNTATAAFPHGLVGLTSGTDAQALPVNWVYLRDSTERIIGRFGYWTDDESSKIDLRFAGNTLGPGGGHLRGDGTNRKDVSLHVLTNFGLPHTRLTNLFFFQSEIDRRIRLAEARYAAGGKISDEEWQAVRPHLTILTLHDDRASDGRRKLNLNEAVTGSFDPGHIAAQVVTIRETILGCASTFGERYFKVNNGVPVLVSPDEREKYVTKLAANIRDTIDGDRNATVMQSDDTATISPQPDFVPYELYEEEIPVFGKEDVPFLNEYLRVVRVVSPVPDAAAASALRDVTIRTAHYVELWNLGPREISYTDLAPHPFVSIANRTKWENTAGGGTPSILRPVDIRIYLPEDFRIPAGGFAVVTTDGPPFANGQTDYHGPVNRYLVTRMSGDTGSMETPVAGRWQAVDAGGQTLPAGTEYEDYLINTSRDSARYNMRAYGAGAGSYSDCRERIVFGNDNGLFDCALRIFTVQNTYPGYSANNPTYLSTFLCDNSSNTGNNTHSGGTTEPRITKGDPRSNTEIFELNPDTGSSWKSGQVSYAPAFAGTIQQTLGALNYNMNLMPTGVSLPRMGWSEYTTDPAGNHHVGNEQLRSLGELGFIYDPARYDSHSYRGAGRTLRIGQSDDPDNNRDLNSTAVNNRNWLGGVGSTNALTTNALLNASHLAGMFRIDETVEGRINPNSVLRGTNSVAVEALLHNFTFTTNALDGASAILGGRVLQSTNLIAAMRESLGNGTPFLGAADISRLPIFNATTNLAGINMTAVSDSGKEEFFRRSAGLMSSESLSFTVFIKAQSGEFRGDRFIPSATVLRECAVQLVPSYPSGQARPFPVSWDVKIVKSQFY